jgi:uncharacterized membrane protein
MEPLSRWRAAALTFFLTIGLTVAVGALPLVGSLTGVPIALGFFVLIPLIVLAPELVPLVDDGNEPERRPPVSDTEPTTRSTAANDPIEDLRDRYANGEISQTEFERRLDDLLATEDVTLGGGRRDDSPRSGSKRSRRERERN